MLFQTYRTLRYLHALKSIALAASLCCRQCSLNMWGALKKISQHLHSKLSYALTINIYVDPFEYIAGPFW